MEGQTFGNLQGPLPYDREVLWVFWRVLPAAIARINSTPSDKRTASTFLDDLKRLVDCFDIEQELRKVGWGDHLVNEMQMELLLMYLEGAVKDELTAP